MTYAPLKRPRPAAVTPAKVAKPAAARPLAILASSPRLLVADVANNMDVTTELASGIRRYSREPVASEKDKFPTALAPGGLVIQRKCDACSDDDDDATIQRKPFDDGAAPIRTPIAAKTKLLVGKPNDPLEREADRIADEIVGQSQTSDFAAGPTAPFASTTSTLNGAGELARRSPAASTLDITNEGTLQRACAACTVEADDEELQRAALPNSPSTTGTPLSSGLTQAVFAARSGGAPLAAGIRSAMEVRFGADFSPVRIHTDNASHRLSRQLHARAFTLGSNIFFGANQFNPSGRAGQKLLAHELTHTLQQRRNLHSVIRRAPNGPTSSVVDAADAVFDEVQLGLLNDSFTFEERVRELTRRERKRLRVLLTSASQDDQVVIDELVSVLDSVDQGFVGATANTSINLPCMNGDVNPVSSDEWEDDPVITDLEIMGGSSVSDSSFAILGSKSDLIGAMTSASLVSRT